MESVESGSQDSLPRNGQIRGAAPLVTLPVAGIEQAVAEPLAEQAVTRPAVFDPEAAGHRAEGGLDVPVALHLRQADPEQMGCEPQGLRG
ncbi:MAG: hypothetical protein ACK53L_35965, partial [Pirellulaceae bacterium]